MRSASVVSITPAHARRFVLRATRLSSTGMHLSDAVKHLGYVQLDPLNVCGRMHDLILRNRVTDYRPGALLRALHQSSNGGRMGFEHYIPGQGVLAAWPVEALPWIQAHLRSTPPRGARGSWTALERTLGNRILLEIADRGPLRSEDIEHRERGVTAWGTQGRLVKIVLEKLFASGELLITDRLDFRRVYDLPSRVLALNPDHKLPDLSDLHRWTVLLRLKQRRLVALPKKDAELVGDQLQSLRVENVGTLYCLRSDLEILEATANEYDGDHENTRLLAPLDPVIYNRSLTAKLWNFDFTWEVYTPPDLRKRGYYSLPVLRGLELVGDVEPRVDWKAKRLTVRSRRLRRGVSTADAISDLASFLGVRPPKS